MLIDTEKTIVPNWFKKEHIEDLCDVKLTKKRFMEFKAFVDNNDALVSSISDDIRTCWFDFKKECG